MEDFIEIFDEIEDDYDVAVRLPRIIHNRVDHFEKWDESCRLCFCLYIISYNLRLVSVVGNTAAKCNYTVRYLAHPIYKHLRKLFINLGPY